MASRKRATRQSVDQKPSAATHVAPSSVWVPWWLGGPVIALFAALIYAPAMHGDTLLDDNELVFNNPLVKNPLGVFQVWATTYPDYWPLSTVSFWFDWRLWRTNTFGYHLTNLVLHIIAAWLLWAVLRRMKIPGAFLAALLFTIHPVNIESVAWIAQRKNLLAMVFFLLSIWWWLGIDPQADPDAERPPGWLSSYSLSLLAFLLASLSKGSVVILPLILLGIILWRRPLAWRDWALTAPFFVLGIAMAALNTWTQTHGTNYVIREAGPIERLLGAGATVWFYLWKALWPLDLAYIYDTWDIQKSEGLWWIPLLAALAVTGALWWFRQGWRKPLLFAWLFYCVALLPAMGFADVGYFRYSLVADHYQHIAIIGLVTLVAAGVTMLGEGKGDLSSPPTLAIGIVLVGALVWLAVAQCKLYASPLGLYVANVKAAPNAWPPRQNVGKAFLELGNTQAALNEYQEIIAILERRRVKRNEDLTQAYFNLGSTLMIMKQYEPAIQSFRKGLEYEPQNAPIWNNLGLVYLDQKNPQEALICLNKARDILPNDSDIYFNLGRVYSSLLSDNQKALYYYEQAHSLSPNIPKHIFWHAKTLQDLGRPAEALPLAKEALALAQASKQQVDIRVAGSLVASIEEEIAGKKSPKPSPEIAPASPPAQ